MIDLAEGARTEAPPSASPPSTRWRVALVAGTLIVAFAAPVLWVVLTRRTPFASDWASIELRTRDVLTANPPLIGAYSRFGWAHPGPLPFYAYALPYRLLGADATAMRVAALLVNACSIWGMVWLLSRRGKAALTVGTLVVAATVWGMYAEAISDPWNATIAVLPFMLTIVGCWSVVGGDRPAIIVTTAAFIFTFQAHIGFGLVLIPVVVVTLLLVRLRHAEPASSSHRWWAWAGVGALVLCIPLVVDTLTDWPGNLARLVNWSITNDVPGAGFARGAAIIGRQTSLSFVTSPRLPIFIDSVLDPLPSSVAPGALVVLLIVAVVVARTRGHRREFELCVLLLVGWAGGLWAAASVRGRQFEWLYGWMEPLAWLSWAGVALVAWRVISPPLRQRLSDRSIAVVGIALAAVVLGGLSIDAGRRSVDGGFVFPDLVAPVAQFTDATLAAGIDGPVRVDFEGTVVDAGGLHAGLVNELDRHGLDVLVDPRQRLQFGDQRVDRGGARDDLLVRAEATAQRPPTGARTLSVYDLLTPAERQEVDQLTADLTAAFEANGLGSKVPILLTSGAGLLLLDDPPPVVLARATAIERLAALRAKGGTRYVLYRLAD